MVTTPPVPRDAIYSLRGLANELALYAAAAMSLVAAMIHLWVAPEHFEEWWGYGTFFVAAAACQGLYATALLYRPGRPLLSLGIGANLALVSFYLVTRTSGIPLGPHAGEVHPVGTLDLVCVAAEGALVVALLARAGSLRAARLYLAFGAIQAFGTGALLHLLHSGMHKANALDPVLHWVQNSLLLIPLSVLAIWISTEISRRFVAFFYGEGTEGLSSRLTWALASAAVYAAASVPADALAAHHAEAGTFLAQAGRDAGVVLGASFLILLSTASLRGAPWGAPKAINFWRPRAAVIAAGLAVGIFAVGGPTLFGSAFVPPADAQVGAQCTAATYDRSYDVAAINAEIPFNRWGGNNIDPHGELFVLQGDKKAVKNWHVRLGATPETDPAGAGNRRLRPRPPVIRANAGECVKVDLTNELDEVNGDELPVNPRVGMKVYGPSYDAQTSDGSNVGYNADTTVGRGQKISLYWKAPSEEGTFLFRDQGVMSGSEANSGSTSHGLYGAFVVEPAGSTWRDPETGKPLYAGATSHSRITKHSGDPYIDADIIPAAGAAFRETVQISQDELPGGNGFSFNYGAEPGFNRIGKNPAGAGGSEQFAPDSIGEETSLSSWTYGDPSLIKLASGKGPWLPNEERTNLEDCGLPTSCYVSNVTHAYPGDPTKIRFAHAGVKETHVFHMHAHQWRIEPNDPGSEIIDSQTYGPGEGFTAELIGGAGSNPKTAGDSIFHCHLYPHFADGFWALFRVHDVLEDGTGKLPDGTKVRALKPLPQGATPPAPTAEKPGYPRFIPGEFGWRAPQPPKGISEPSGVADNPATVAREDLKPAERVVAGRPLDGTLDPTDPMEKELAEKLQLEQKAMLPGANPGAPFAEPCPAGSREVTYNVSAIQTDVTYNERGDHDTQGRILVLTKDVPEILAGTKEPEPLFIRVNAGDCINYNLTNYLPNWIGGDAFLKIAQTNMAGAHVHLVKFDVMASDGSSNGWNYAQAAFTKEQADFNENRDPLTNNVRNCDPNGCRIEDPATWDPATESNPVAPGQTIHERWYADTELKTVFTHDHHFAALDQNRGYFGALIVEPRGMDFRNPSTGQFYQPGNGSAPGAPICRSECTGNAAGTAMDIIGPGASDDFREFGLAVQDFVSLTKRGGNPRLASDTINPPNAPERFPDDDPGTMAINYKNAPFVLRDQKNGRPTDPAHVFSSTVHGDPMTPVLEAYSQDPVRIRLIQGSQEEQHVMTMHGMRWREEPNDPNSPLINSKAIGVSEAFNFEVPRIACGPDDETCAGDYLYSGTATDDLYLGAWGILRARGKEVSTLLPLPDNAVRTATNAATPTSTAPQGGVPSAAIAPPEATSPGNPCPTGAPTKKFNVIALEANIDYNEQGDHDPYGLMYALAQPGESIEEAVSRARANPQPLVIRANEGECLEVRLYNRLTHGWLQKHSNAGTDGDPTLPTEPTEGTPSGLRVSLHPQLVKYDVRGSDGTAVGYNRDQSVAPGESRLYRWYADDAGTGELGATNLTDFGDVRGHRHHGLFAGLNIEPKGATYHDPQTGKQITSGASADIRVPGANNDFREFTTFFQDGLNLRDASGAVIEDPLDHPPTPEEPLGEGMDAEDMGEKAFNYANAPFHHRIGDIPESGMDGHKMAHVFDSRVHGDPDTPIFRAYAGDRIRMRVLQGSDKPRQHSFQVSGHAWRAQPGDPDSELIGTQGGISVGRTLNLHFGSAGSGHPGDYRYGCGVGFHHMPGGLWGIVRLYPEPPVSSILRPTKIGETDDPMAGGHPILPLEIAAIKTSLSLDAKPSKVTFGGRAILSGELARGGKALVGRTVTLEHKPAGAGRFARIGTRKTASNGSFSFAVKPQKNTYYRARFAGSEGAKIQASTSPTKRVMVRARLSLRTSTGSLPAGKRLRISGAVAPAHTRLSVGLIIERNGRVVKRVNRPLDSRSRYGFAYRPGRPGRYTITAVFREHDDHLGARTTRKVRVYRRR